MSGFNMRMAATGQVCKQLDVTVTVSATSKPIPANSVLVIKELNGFRSCSKPVGAREIKVGEDRKLHIVAIPLRFNLLDTPGKIDLALLDNDGKELHSTTFDLEWPHWKPAKYFRATYKLASGGNCGILFLGPPGAGKSSELSTIHSALGDSKAPEYEVALAAGGVDHVTTTYNKKVLPALPHVAIYDPWGLTETNYLRGELTDMLLGLMPLGQDMREPLSQEARRRQKRHAVHSRCQGMLVAVPTPILGDDRSMALIKSKIVEARKQNITPLVLLARVDSKVDDIRTNPLGEHDDLAELVDQASKKLGVQPGTVLPMVPYVGEKKRSFEIEKLGLHIMERVLQIACNREKQLLQSMKDEMERKSRPKGPKPGEDHAMPSPWPKKKVPKQRWACWACTFFNPPDASRCEMCTAANPAAEVDSDDEGYQEEEAGVGAGFSSYFESKLGLGPDPESPREGEEEGDTDEEAEETSGGGGGGGHPSQGCGESNHKFAPLPPGPDGAVSLYCSKCATVKVVGGSAAT